MAIIKQKEQRVGVFIDAQNIYHSAKNLYRTSVNFKNVLKKAVSERQLIKAVAYVIKTESGDEDNFFDALVEMGIETKQKDLQIFHTGVKKADWDVGLAVDAISIAQKLDVIVIVSGDGDFIPLVEYLKFAGGCQVELISFKKSTSANLLTHVDDFVDMSEDKENFLFGFKKRQKKSESEKKIKNKNKKVEKKDNKDIEKKTKTKVEGVNKKIKQNLSIEKLPIQNKKTQKEKIKISGITKAEEKEVDDFLNNNLTKKTKKTI